MQVKKPNIKESKLHRRPMKKQLDENEINLLTIDLCGRAPYGTCFIQFPKSGIFPDGMEDTIQKVSAKDIRRILVNLQVIALKPYLRRMTSMTDEEKKFYYGIVHIQRFEGNYEIDVPADNPITTIEISRISELINWLNEHCFDYRGLIDMGIAIEAPKEMYTFN